MTAAEHTGTAAGEGAGAHSAQGRKHLLPPHAYFVVSAIFHYLGPALAVLLVCADRALGVAWLRIASAAVVFTLWRRPGAALGRPLLLGAGGVALRAESPRAATAE